MPPAEREVSATELLPTSAPSTYSFRESVAGSKAPIKKCHESSVIGARLSKVASLPMSSLTHQDALPAWLIDSAYPALSGGLHAGLAPQRYHLTMSCGPAPPRVFIQAVTVQA